MSYRDTFPKIREAILLGMDYADYDTNGMDAAIEELGIDEDLAEEIHDMYSGYNCWVSVRYLPPGRNDALIDFITYMREQDNV
jgi:hypothetical protein